MQASPHQVTPGESPRSPVFETQTCSLCLEELTEADPTDVAAHQLGEAPATTDHWFHRDCLVRHLATAATCPNCRADLLTAGYHVQGRQILPLWASTQEDVDAAREHEDAAAAQRSSPP